MKNFVLTILSLLICLCAINMNAQVIKSEHIDQLKFRHVGPLGNRISAVTGIEDDPLVYYVGAATGGIWKTSDGGINWKPVFDDKPVHSIGALAVAPSDSEVIYAGTGESFIRSNVSIGNGMWKSTDGGESWEHIGLKKSGRISRIVVHPDNANIVYVAAMGHGYSPQREKGVFKTVDGGKTWKHVLFVDQKTGCSDIVMNPVNPRIMFAGMWQLELKTWNRTSGGPGSGLYKSKDGGDTWEKVEHKGLPQKDMGKIALAMTPANPQRVYALIETGDGVPFNGEETESGELWRSEDVGKTWKLINSNRDLGGRQAYYTRCAASPDNPNEIYFIWANFSTSIDGGLTTQDSKFLSQPNWDHHEMWIDPSDGNRMIVVGDGGLSISRNRGKSWHRTQLPVAQLYHVTTDNNVPYNVLTNRQDGPAMKGPSRTNTAGIFGPSMIPTGLWYDISGGESGFATADPTDPDIIWSSASGFGPLGGIVSRFNDKTRQYRQVEVWPEFTAGHPAEAVKYRFQWTFPLLISPHDNNTVYVTSQFVHRTTNGGQSWEVISPDLTLNDKSKQGFSGGLTGDNINVEYANVIYAFEESPIKQGVFWAGTNDGLVQISQDSGATWTNVTSNIPGLPKDGVVRNIEASKWNAGKAYITVEFHQVGNFKPYVYKTENYGRNWTKIINGIANENLSYTRNIIEDPVKEGLLYLGTENKLYISFNDGRSWQQFMSNLPATPMYWLDIQEHFNDLVVGTYGRGIWILDDITPLQELSSNTMLKDAYLFSPKPTYRFRPVSSTMQFFPEPSFGQDPPYGASINFWLKEENEKVKVHIVNETGDTIRTLKHKGKEGINRIWWNLEGEPNEKLLMRTKPQYADWVPLDKDRTRKVNVSTSILMPPGTYEVHVEAGHEVESKELVVMKDPKSEGTLEQIGEQHDLVTEVYNSTNEIIENINEIEEMRRQLLDMRDIMKAKDMDKMIIDTISHYHKALVVIESSFIQLKYSGHGQDEVRYPARLVRRMNYLTNGMTVGDFRPTDQQREVYDILKERANTAIAEYNDWKQDDLSTLRSILAEKNIGALIE